MGLSYGVLQWNIGQGTMQVLLSDMFAAHHDVVASIFGDRAAPLVAMLTQPRAAQLAWARSIQDAHHNVYEPWKTAFLRLGATPEFQAIQLAHAERIHQKAWGLCKRFGVTSERALALMFDICVQNGSIASDVETKIRADFATFAADDELAKLRSIANRRAEAANPRFIEDVRARKLTIADGHGKVHGIQYDLERQFGIRLLPVAA